ncbi:MAG: CoA-acylating methylmalonate-semialdehyde dehydrogenase [Planctomycetes bacterium]|nr:CoA-acylating methylmalonate-semialdehyde dehydrogenase [Planctomycetota bacterium]
MTRERTLPNFVNGTWSTPSAVEFLPVLNPATGETIARMPLSDGTAVDAAVRAADVAFKSWSRTPVVDRVQFVFKFKFLLEQHLEELARTIVDECGKTRQEALGELRRGIENVEVACGIPSLLQGYNNEEIAAGIDEHLFRQPLGVVAAITPFNFPAMIPLWFLSYAIACGNSIILKPSEQTPMACGRLFELLAETGLPKGVAQLVHGGKETVEALVDHPLVQAVSLVGSTETARAVYRRATALGKRAQCNGGAKNPVIILPDADMKLATQSVADSTFGCAGQRCLGTSLAITVGEARRPFTEAISAAASERRVGYGGDEGVQMGPVISRKSQARIEKLIAAGIREGGVARVEGRGRKASGLANGSFVFPTVLDNVAPQGEIARTEIFGPVLGLIAVDSLEEAIELVNNARYGNMACLFTSSGAAARTFRHDVAAGNIGINVKDAAPMAFFSFGGTKESFFGDLHPQGRHAVEFYTQTKVVIEHWPRR